jgi:hypothetical protein
VLLCVIALQHEVCLFIQGPELRCYCFSATAPLQVLSQWESVRESLYEFSRHDRPQPNAAWRYVLKQHSLEDVCDIVSLYVLGQLLPAQSSDVERGFTLANDCLGLRRLSTRIQTLNRRLRVKQTLHVDPTKSDLMWIG